MTSLLNLDKIAEALAAEGLEIIEQQDHFWRNDAEYEHGLVIVYAQGMTTRHVATKVTLALAMQSPALEFQTMPYYGGQPPASYSSSPPRTAPGYFVIFVRLPRPRAERKKGSRFQ